jgi:pimeloyl-ACP methyl ester carboxylesterase
MRSRAMKWAAAAVALAATAGLGAQRSPAPDVREGVAEVPGARLFYIDSGGSGAPIVLLHPATGSVRIWTYQIPAFAAAGYRVLAFDRRGWGRTTLAPAGPQPGTAADDLAALLDVLRLDRVHVLGAAGGGIVAFDFALSYPTRLRSLVVANSIGGVQDESYLALGRRLRPPEFAAMPPELREVSPAYRASNPDGTRQWVELEHLSRPPGPPAPAQPTKNMLTFARLASIKAPTLLLTGGADMFSPPPVMRLFADRITHAETVVVPEAGHSTYWEQPDVFNRAVLDFITKHR